jgi:serine/threonine-protein kinase
MSSLETRSLDSEDDSLLGALAAAPHVNPALIARLRRGAVVRDRYTLERRIGEGGMGIVWAAHDRVTDVSVALKFLKQSVASRTARRRFLREARTAGAIQHENVVKVLDVFELEDGLPVMVLELLDGESLASRLDRREKLPLDETARILLEVTSAVGTAHACGVVHRDLKPHNIFLCRGEGGGTVKVLDFGVAKLMAEEVMQSSSTALTGTGALLGTPCYMSPEQAFGEQNIDHRADIWGLGIMLYECLSGVLPTRADNVGQVLKIILEESIAPLDSVVPELPHDIAALVAKMLQRRPEARPSDLREVQAVLAAHVDTKVVSFGPPAARTSRALSYVGAALLAIVSTFVVWQLRADARGMSVQSSLAKDVTNIPSAPAREAPAQVTAPVASTSAPTVKAPAIQPRPAAPKPPTETAPEPSAPESERLPGGVVKKPPF